MGGPKLMYSFFFLFIIFATIIPCLMAHIGDFDEVWRRRAEEAREYARQIYEPNPENVTLAFNQKVRDSMKEVTVSNNSTRRGLGTKKYKGPCMVTNPIDRCWRCDPNWADNRKRLADCAMGFGSKATGGKDGEIYIVTDNSDDYAEPKPGTLRYAVIQKEPLWIIFERSMTIRLHQELIMQSDKTIDARGANVHIAKGAGITLQYIKNVIIHGLHIHDIVEGSGGMVRDAVDHIGIRTVSDGDGISIFGASNIWIDHVSMRKCYDGIIDAVEGSTAITISNGHFTDHNEVMLFGASDSSSIDQVMQITLAFNHFGKRLVQRMPRCRWGYIHVVNNDYTHWNMYAIGGSMHPTIITQGNRFIAPPDIFKKQVTKREYNPEEVWKHWTWRSEGNLFMNGAYFIESGDPDWSKKHKELYDGISAAPAEEVTWITRFAGALGCKKGKAC
ncbi:probable pectate lyase P59 isoform X1 [Nicotiana tomentosiformis]|nr:probable pectate lyase P59 isoform X1 [Nicotiana tomentosiformis]XP_016469146.1 PREDICTED: probable pectate lyase P59 isoform X1 [Nicotiana tabacum]